MSAIFREYIFYRRSHAINMYDTEIHCRQEGKKIMRFSLFARVLTRQFKSASRIQIVATNYFYVYSIKTQPRGGSLCYENE